MEGKLYLLRDTANIDLENSEREFNESSIEYHRRNILSWKEKKEKKKEEKRRRGLNSICTVHYIICTVMLNEKLEGKEEVSINYF